MVFTKNCNIISFSLDPVDQHVAKLKSNTLPVLWISLAYIISQGKNNVHHIIDATGQNLEGILLKNILPKLGV